MQPADNWPAIFPWIQNPIMNNPNGYILGLGIAVSDYLALVETYPLLDQKTEAVQSDHQGGGPIATAMAAASVLDSKSMLIAVVGDDHDGRFVRQQLEMHGVITSQIIVDPESRTPRANIWVEKQSGLRTVVLDATGSRTPLPEEIPEKIIAGAGLVLVDGRGIETTRRTVSLAEKHGIPTMIDAGSLRPGILEVLNDIDIVICSRNFALEYSQSRDPMTALHKIHHPERIITVITLGKNGYVAKTNHTVFNGKSLKTEILDTTGAGDVFHGAYAAAFIHLFVNQDDIHKKCLEFSATAAALSCRGLGGRGSLPSVTDVLNHWKYQA